MPARKKIKDRYDTLDIIGKGGMGLVYKAYDTVVQREVALKTLRDSPNKMALDLFRKECGVLASMSHPNIVEIFDIGEFSEDGTTKPYFVMPLLPGVTLDHLIKTSSQRLTVERSVEIILQTCRGLHAAHERGLVHRDLKPSNIFVMPDDAVKIIDFGVAHMADTTATMTVAGGTLPYMAPEQLEMKPASALSDIFSLGVVFYETLTRRRPFDFPTEQETAHAIMHHVPPAASELNPAVSQMVSRVIHKAMAKQPWNRFSTAKEFAETLIKAQRNETIEIFDTARVQPRIQKASKAYDQGNFQFAAEILNELEAEGHVETTMTLLRRQLDQAVRQKTIGQLLESARTCMEAEEYLLALQKIQEILQLDPTNNAALILKGTIDTRRSEAKVDEWLKLARQHLENNAFSHSRDALQNLLQLRPKDTSALQMLAEVDRREEQYVKARKEKEQLYKLALEAWQSGEMSSALTKLERLVELDRRVPDTAAPDRGISYQTFYNQVRSEHDLLRNSYQEARKHLTDGNFTSALSICQQYLAKYPGHALFQALKFDVEERQRQDLSSRVAEIDRRVEGEPDLERRVNILKEALETYPGEPHFERSLRLMRDKRDLVNSIVAKSRAYEERAQFNEALGQWEILQTIHKQYPGLEFEIERVMKRRDQQARAEAKARWVEQVDRQLEAGDYERAIELLRNAEAEFPDDSEMAALGELARQSQARATEADKIFKNGQELCAERRFDEAIELLRRAYEMDPNNRVIRAFLLETLLEHARAVLDTDWRTADALSQQALDLDPGHSLANGVRGMALDRKRQEEVSQWVGEARRLQAAGNVPGALAQIEQGLGSYPRETRLTQLHATLCKSIPDHQSRAEALSRATAAQSQPETQAMTPAAQQPAPAGWEEFERKLREQPASDLLQPAARAEGEQAAEAQQVAESQPAVESRRSAYESAMSAPAAQPGVDEGSGQGGAIVPTEPGQPAAEPVGSVSGRFATMVMQTAVPGGVAAPPHAPSAPAMPPQPPKNIERAQPDGTPKPKTPVVGKTVVWGCAAAAVLIVAAIIAFAVRPVTIEIRTNPPGATIRVDNQVRGASNLSLKLRTGAYQIAAEKEGYLPASGSLLVQRGSQTAFDLSLTPVPPQIPKVELPQSLRLASDLAFGKVKLDDQTPSELQDGQFTNDGLGWGTHTLEITSGGAKASIPFEASPGRAPVLTGTPTAKEVKAVVVTSFGNHARIQATYSPVKVMVDNRDLGDAGTSGIDVPDLAPGDHSVILTEGKDRHTMSLTNGSAPILQIQLYSDRNVGSLLIQTGEDDASVQIDGKPQKKRSKGGQVRITNLPVKAHTVRVSKDGFQEAPEQSVEIKKGEEAKLQFTLRQVPTVSALAIHGAAAGLQISLDQKSVGAVGADGSFSFSNVAPGNHVIDVTDGHRHRQFTKAFKAGETVQLAPSEIVLQSAKVPVKIAVSPANAVVTYKTPDGKSHDVHGTAVELEEGQYVFTASAAGHADKSETVVVVGGKAASVVLDLTAKAPAKPSPPIRMEEWAASVGWKLENDWYVHRGGGPVLFPAVPSSGTIVFTAMRQAGLLGKGRIQWLVGYSDDKSNYILFGIDKKNIHRLEMAGGKKVKDSEKTIALKTAAPKELQYTVKVEISPETVVTSIRQGSDWVVVDTWPASGLNPANGKFGFYLPNNDEVYLSNFSFTPK
jgi:serine/threonine protein kinase